MPIPDSANAALQRWAEETPDAACVVIDGRTYTYREVRQSVDAVAAGLLGRGTEPGDRVAIVADTCPEYLWLWLALNLISAVDVPVNVHVRGESLRSMLADADPSAIVCSPVYLPDVVAVRQELSSVRLLAAIGDDPSDTPNVLPYAEIPAPGSAPARLPNRSSLATIMYTSGTTGPSKGVMLPQHYYAYYGSLAADLVEMGPAERMYCCQPLYHIDGRLAVLCALLSGGAVVLERRFSASGFWSGVREAGATRLFYVGSMLWMLHQQPPSPTDSEQPARIGIGSSTPAEIVCEFEARFSTRLIDTFGMTEGVLLTGSPVDESKPGTMGRPVPGATLALLDGGDRPVPIGEVGQIALRPGQPDVLPHGYWNMPEVTVEAWRNLWFHTGDLAREDDDGYWVYVGRMKDAIRRRGENISAWEVEQAFLRLDGVAEAAALGVPSPVGEEDLAVLVVMRPSHRPDAGRLSSEVARDVPAYMVPRFVEFVDELPKTASHRIDKGKVRERGITEAAWDAGWPGPQAR